MVEPIVGSNTYPEEFREAVRGRIKRRIGNIFGLNQFGVNHVILGPGSASAVRHWHEKEDEFIYVLEGELTLVTDEGETVVKAGEFAGFPAGVPNGHQVVNRSAADAAYLEVGSRMPDEKAHYPDDDLEVRREDGVFRFYRKDGTPY